MPYPGTIKTDEAASKIRYASWALIGLTSPCSSPVPVDVSDTAPNPLNKTLAKDLFMALHMIFVRIKPLAPTRDPATINTLLVITKPAAQANNNRKCQTFTK